MYHVHVTTTKGTVIASEMVSELVCRIGKTNDNNSVLHGWQIGQRHAQ